ncbi:hypothetical protein A2U01_0044644, partial [Trifolium medium]|nr:hypothetical protein [Trifolium medium]
MIEATNFVHSSFRLRLFYRSTPSLLLEIAFEIEAENWFVAAVFAWGAQSCAGAALAAASYA